MRGRLLLLICMASASLLVRAGAQQTPQQSKAEKEKAEADAAGTVTRFGVVPTHRVAPPKSDPHEHDTEKMVKPVSLPHLPDYTGSQPKFVSGIFYPRIKTGQCYTMTYAVREAPGQVYDWYSAVLEQNQWKVDPQRPGHNTISAKRPAQGLYLSVSISPNLSPPYRSYLTIREIIHGAPSSEP